MARYTDASRERVRDAIDFVELVSARTELRRAGANRLVGLCPFHEERTPSFGIDPAAKLYHCFGCGEGGDVFHFAMATEGLDFTGALEWLAARAGVELEREAEDPRDAERRVRRDRLLALLERTAAYYVRVLWESREAAGAREYLASRGLEEEMLREFRVGWAPSAWDKVLTASRRAGFSEEELLAAGLATRGGSGGVYDWFRARVVFPLADARGRVLGFGGRALRENQGPKYVNSPDREVYRKGQHVYAHDLARVAAARAGEVVLAEGYTDVIALHAAGIRNVVGLMGTALTPEQAAKLRQLAPVTVLCLDADAAGREAMAKAAELLGGPRREVRVVRLPAASDPADLVQAEGPDAMRGRLERSIPFARFQIDRVLEGGDLRTPEGRDRTVDALRPVFAGVPEGFLRQDLLGTVADRMDATPDLLARLLPIGRGAGRSARGSSPAGASRGRDGGRGAAEGLTGAERASGGAARAGDRFSRPGRDAGAAGDPLAAPTAGAPAAGPTTTSSPDASWPPARTPEPWTRAEDTERAFLARCLAVRGAGRDALADLDVDELFASELTRRAARHLAAHPDHPGEGLPRGDDTLARLVAELVIRAAALPADHDALALERLQLDKLRLDRQITAARRSGAPLTQLAAERQRIQDAIRHRLV